VGCLQADVAVLPLKTSPAVAIGEFMCPMDIVLTCLRMRLTPVR